MTSYRCHISPQTIPLELPVLIRDRDNRMYKIWVYYLSKTLAEVSEEDCAIAMSKTSKTLAEVSSKLDWAMCITSWFQNSNFQWRPFCPATWLNLQHDWAWWRFHVNCDVFAQASATAGVTRQKPTSVKLKLVHALGLSLTSFKANAHLATQHAERS